MRSLTYRQARTIVLGFGTALIVGVALAAWYRGADPVEVGAILLFVPVLAGLAFDFVRGGLIAGVAVTVIYTVVRFSTLGDLPKGEFIGAAVVRALLYLGLGAFGGWANRMLEESLRKLELYDEIDDDTGVGNARALLSISDLEIARAERYGTVFSLVRLQLDRAAFAPLDRRQAIRALRQLCQTVESNVRVTDLVTRVPLQQEEDVVVILPETGRSGAELLRERLVDGARMLLVDAGAAAQNGTLSGTVLTFPGDDEAMRAYREQVAAAFTQRQVVEA